jgi:hypothetical protein
MKKSKYFVNRRLIGKEISVIPGKRGSPRSALTKKGSLASLTVFAMTDSGSSAGSQGRQPSIRGYRLLNV